MSGDPLDVALIDGMQLIEHASRDLINVEASLNDAVFWGDRNNPAVGSATS